MEENDVFGEVLTDKAGNRIDVNVLAGVYLSTFELMAYFKKCTNYSAADARSFAKRIDKLGGNDYSSKDARFIRKKIESLDWDFSTPAKKGPRDAAAKNISQSTKDINLIGGEQVLAIIKPSCIPLIAWVIVGIWIFCISCVYVPKYSALLTVFCVIPLIWEITRVFSNKAVLTTKRVCIRMLVPRNSSADIPLSKINSITASGPSKGYKYGALSINTSSGNFDFKGMKNPGAFRDSVVAAIDANTSDKMRRQAEEIAKAMRQ